MQELDNTTAHSIFLTKIGKASHAHTTTKILVEADFTDSTDSILSLRALN